MASSRSLPRTIPLLACIACASAGGSGPGDEPAEPDPAPLRAALAAAVAKAGSWTDLRLLVECQGDHGPRTVEVFGDGVAVWQRSRQFRLEPQEVSALAGLLAEADFPGLAESYGGKGIADPGARDEPPGNLYATVVVCQIELELDGLAKRVTQLAYGKQSPEVLGLAGALLDACAEKGVAGIGAADLRDGLVKVAAGDLDPRVFSVLLQRRPAPGRRGEGFQLRIAGARATTRVWTPAEGFAAPLEIELSPDELDTLARALAENDPAGLPVNLWSSEYTELTVSVLDHEASIQARRFAGMTPATHGERQERFDRLVEALHQVQMQVAINGRPPAAAP